MTIERAAVAAGPRADGVRPQAQGSARSLGSLPAALRLIAAQPDERAATCAIAEQFVSRMGALSASVYLLERSGGRTLRLVASRGVDAGSPLDRVDIDASSLPVARAARSRALQLVANANPATVRDSHRRLPLARCGPAVTFALPLVVRARLLGVVTADLATRLEPADIEELDSLGALLGTIVDHARLEAEIEARDGWTRVVTHELRQPLNTVSLYAAWLSRDLAEGAAASSVKQLLEGVRRADHLVGDLVDTTINDISRVRLATAPTDLVALAQGMADSVAPARVKVEAPSPVLEAEVDPARLEQVLANLLANAFKYGRRGPEITLRIEPWGADAVALSVTNEGADIPEEERARVFERYYRTRSGTADGWGIGLYVCRGLVEAHGGRIGIESRGGITAFTVVLPRVQPARPERCDGRSAEAAAAR
jgi:signal transduction histidine kinase